MTIVSMGRKTLVLTLGLALAGCGSSGKDPAKPSAGSGSKPGAASPEPTQAALPELKGDVTLEVATWDQVKEKIAAQKGKVVVLDVWSNWCDPCMKEFPNLVTLQRAHPDDLVCMSLNTNFAGLTKELTEEDKAKALDFLKEKGAKFPNFICSDTDETLYGQIPITSVPTVLVYGRDGELAQKFDEDTKTGKVAGFTYKRSVTPFVEELLKKKP